MRSVRRAKARIYYTGTTGFVEVFKQIDADHYDRLEKSLPGRLRKTTPAGPRRNLSDLCGDPQAGDPGAPHSAIKRSNHRRRKILVYDVIP